MVLCSIYMKIESLYVVEKLKELYVFCKRSNRQLIVGGDFNAHHRNWGSENNNLRGENIVNFIAGTDLILLNNGSKPTFERANASTIIDLTLASQYFSTKIQDWKVLDEFTGSDHKYITFTIKLRLEYKLKTRSPRKTNWELYRETLVKNLREFPTQLNGANDLEMSCPSQ